MSDQLASYARVIEDSINAYGDRLTTFEVCFHRFVLAEFNTHRAFSRNSASSRAIPVAKQLERALTSPALPVSWPAEQKGMQGGAALEGEILHSVQAEWEHAKERAVESAQSLTSLGLHKSVTNRLLEPFLWHTTVVTSTAWVNFFALRCDKDAQPEIKAAADLMLAAYDASTPVLRREGEASWHMPYIDFDTGEEAEWDPWLLAKVSAARCARVSYLTQDGVRDLKEDLRLYERLTDHQPMHASPLEHVARPEGRNREWTTIYTTDPEEQTSVLLPRYGNLVGWHQLRFDVEARQRYQAYA